MSKKISEILNTATGHPLDVYYTLCIEYLSSSEVPAKVLEEILQFKGSVGADNAGEVPRYIAKELVEEVREEYSVLLQSIVRSMVQQNPTVDEFFEKLYENVFKSDLFPSEKESQTVLLYMLGNDLPEIPYYPAVDLYTIDDDTFLSQTEAITPQFDEAMHMLNRRFRQKTEIASQLYRISKTIQDEKDRIVYWALVLGVLRQERSQKEER